jgi:hypothetical protein
MSVVYLHVREMICVLVVIQIKCFKLLFLSIGKVQYEVQVHSTARPNYEKNTIKLKKLWEYNIENFIKEEETFLQFK